MPRTEDYEHLLIQQIHLEWRAKANDPEFDRGRSLGQEFTLGLDLALHPNTSGRIIINYPGWKGAMDGYMEKHKKLAQYMQGENLGAVVRAKGSGFPDFDGFTIDIQLRKMIDYSLENAEALCASQKPEVLLIGTSAGGGAAAAIAHEYEAVKRILLMAPGYNMAREAVERLRDFAGEVFIVIGQEDRNVGVSAGKVFYDLATKASSRELFIIPNCDHNFTGTMNGRIMSEAPFYAFTLGERPKFPDTEGGMVLY